MAKRSSNDQKEDMLKFVKHEIDEKRAGRIHRFTDGRELEIKFNLTEKQVYHALKNGLDQKDRSYRTSEIKSQTAKGNKGNSKFYGIHLSKSERRYNIFREIVSEGIIKLSKEEDGFTVVKLMIKKESDGIHWSQRDDESILKLKHGKRILSDLDKLEASMRNFKCPDFVCVKDDLIQFTEVKSMDELDIRKVKQKHTLDLLHDMGYNVEVLSVSDGEILELLHSLIQEYPDMKKVASYIEKMRTQRLSNSVQKK